VVTQHRRRTRVLGVQPQASSCDHRKHHVPCKSFRRWPSIRMTLAFSEAPHCPRPPVISCSSVSTRAFSTSVVWRLRRPDEAREAGRVDQRTANPQSAVTIVHGTLRRVRSSASRTKPRSEMKAHVLKMIEVEDARSRWNQSWGDDQVEQSSPQHHQ